MAQERSPSRQDLISLWLASGILAITTLGVLFTPASVVGVGPLAPNDQFLFRLYSILVGSFLAAYFFVPSLTCLVGFFQRHWRSAYTYGVLLGICTFLCAFLVHFGRWQFGGYDYSIMVETGWRQIQGQRPYVDFPTTTPPGFNLGIKYAYRLFGVTWDANLYLCAIFACLTFLWMYWLMIRLSLGRLAAMATAFAIECAAMLTLCFWWYNDSVMVLAAVFFLSCLAYAGQPREAAVQVSYVIALTLLSLMKPNIAGMMIVGGVVLLFVVTERKSRLVLLTLAATAAAVMALLANHISIPAMLASYLSVTKEHGSLSSGFGYKQITGFDRYSALFWIAVLSAPLLGLAPKIFRFGVERDWKAIIYCSFFPLTLMIALYGLGTNGEYRDVDCTVLLAAGAVLTFGLRWNSDLLRRVYIAILFTSIALDLYFGATRTRVYLIGSHLYFEYNNNQNDIQDGFLKNMHVSSTMVELEREIKLAKDTNSGPFFIGPRMEFNYAVLGIPSPRNFPAWWEPGTAFAVTKQSNLLQVWQQNKNQTLIFLKSGFAGHPDDVEYFYYTKDFRAVIDEGYVRDERYPLITVYHRRSTVSQ